MKARITVVALVLAVVCAATLSAHDMFIKLDSYFMAPGDTLRVPILNGTFTQSANSIAFDRVSQVLLLAPEGFTSPKPLDWSVAYSDSTTQFGVVLHTPGTYALGVSTKPRELAQTADAFNKYLKEEGITDVLALRKKNGQMNWPARERYSKNVKAVFQVGEDRTPQVNMPFGSSAEVVPLDNPYAGSRTGVIRMLCLVGSKPVAGMTVLVGSQLANERPHEISMVTDANGVIAVRITRKGRWYVKFVHMVHLTGGEIDYESRWASLTFQVR
jgi:uncharacterized GH25 family protein